MYFKIILLCVVLLTVRNGVCDDRKAMPFVPEVADHVLKAVKQCMVEFDNNPKTVELIREGSFAEYDDFKKFIHCSYYRSGYSYPDGRVMVDKIVKAFPPEANIGDVTKKCGEIKGKDAVDTTFQFFKCFELNSPIRIALS